MNINRGVVNNIANQVWMTLKVDWRLLWLDLALVVVATFLVFFEGKIVLFHVIFLLLTIGAFYWSFQGFVLRSTLWLSCTAFVLFASILLGEIPFEEIFELPMLTLVLVLVYTMAGQRAKASDSLRERTDELSMLLEVSNQTTLTHRLEPLLGLILDHLKTVVDYKCAAIFRLDGKTLNLLLDRGSARSVDNIPRELSTAGSELGSKLLVDQQIIMIPDIWAETSLARELRDLFGDQFDIEHQTAISWMGVPLKVYERVIGMLALQHSGPLHHFSPNNADLVLGFANQAAVAIEAAQYHEQAQTLAAIQERERLARDLHDAVSQTLFSASLAAEVLPLLWERNPTEGRRCLDEIYHLNRSALAEMRTLLLELRPDTLIEMGLGDLIAQLAGSICSRIRLPVNMTLEPTHQLPPDVHMAFYRICQEALNNIVKHAAASQVEICLQPLSPEGSQLAEQGLRLCIRDDGQGFDASDVFSTSMGLNIMQERAKGVGAELKVYSAPGQGAEVVVTWIGAV